MTGPLISFDFESLAHRHGWRDGLRWPVHFLEIRKTLELPQENFFAHLDELELGDRSAALLAGGLLCGLLSSEIEGILVAEGVQRCGMTMDSAETMVQRDAAPVIDRIKGRMTPAAIDRVTARRLARIASWSRWWQLPGRLLAPEATAISHNPMLILDARERQPALGYLHADLLLADARRQDVAVDESAVERLTRWASSSLLRGVVCTPDHLHCLSGLTEGLARSVFRWALRDLAGLDRITLPKTMWSGTGGAWAPRAIGLAAMRQHGTIRRYDHGGSVATIYNPNAIEMIELGVSSQFVLASEAMRRLVEDDLLAGHHRVSSCEIVNGAGDPAFAAVPTTPRRDRGRPKVLYVSTILRGRRHVNVPLLPDPVYLDWQIRLAEMLGRMPVELLCKPHPEGLMKGRTHPLAEIAPTSAQRFEEHIEDTDVFVFDYAHTTTFWKALCSGKPVVLIDLGNIRLGGRILEGIRQRATIITARFGEDGLPYIDEDALEAAIRQPGNPDPAFFRDLFAGERGG